MRKITTVDEYIALSPEKIQEKLKALRNVIKETAPEAEERISYSMPFYSYKGRFAYFSFTKSHIGLYIPPPVIQEHAKELEAYQTATATVRFPLNEDLPFPLIKKLLKARMKLNEEANAK